MKLKQTKVAVTGADGFIGSHLCEELVRQGCELRALAQYNSFGHFGWLEDLPAEIGERIEIVLGDVRDPHQMIEFVKDREVVLHLASLIGIPYSYHAPDSYVDTNVKGTLNLLQAARANGVAKFVHTSTSEVYGSAQRVPMDESHPLSAQSPYAATKIAADQLALSFHRSFDLPVTVIRPFNTYGPRQSARAVIPTIITQLLNGDGKVTLGSLTPKRDFTFVTDVVAGFVRAVEAEKIEGEVVNLGSGEEYSIGQLAEKIAALMDREAKVISHAERFRPEDSEVDRLLCGASKAERLLGWKTTVSLEEGLRRAIDWFSVPDNLAKYKPGRYQI